MYASIKIKIKHRILAYFIYAHDSFICENKKVKYVIIRAVFNVDADIPNKQILLTYSCSQISFYALMEHITTEND